MTAASPDVDVVVVAYGSGGHLEDCIASARSWARVSKVVVVDNGSPDDSAAVARASGADVVVELPENVGFGAGQNAGASHASAPFLLVLNPDARVVAAGLEAGYCELVRTPDIAMVEGIVRRSHDDRPERWQGKEPGLADLVARALRLRERLGEERLRKLADLARLHYFSRRDLATPVDVAFLTCVAPLVRREAFDAVDGFDEAIFLYAEDVDLCHRLREAGWRLRALPVDWAQHVGGASSAQARPEQRLRWWQGHRVLVEKHWTGTRRVLGVALARWGEAAARRQLSRG